MEEILYVHIIAIVHFALLLFFLLINVCNRLSLLQDFMIWWLKSLFTSGFVSVFVVLSDVNVVIICNLPVLKSPAPRSTFATFPAVTILQEKIALLHTIFVDLSAGNCREIVSGRFKIGTVVEEGK